MSQRPNIIIFNPDEMRADALHHLGNPAVRTPNLDAFARSEAVSFENAFCQNPVCVPSRCSFFTGLYPHVRGHRTMTYLLHPGESSLFGELKDAGYYVWMNDRNDLLAGQYKGWMESQADEIHYSGQIKRAPGPVIPDRRGEPGNPYYYSHYQGELKTDARGLNYNEDDAAVDAAAAKIKSWKKDGQPLCMFLGLFYPHPPYQVEEPYFSAINRSRLPKRIRWEDCSGKSRMLAEYHKYQNLGGLSEAQWDELRAVYLGMCMKVDAQFGRLCAALKQADLYDSSAIFVLSDHGDFTGDYGLAEKAQSSFEDCLTRVPLLVKPPASEPADPGISSSMAELVDFYATVMDYAGVRPSHTHFGKSLRPIIENRTAENREYVFCEGGRLPEEKHCDEYHQIGGTTASPGDVYWPKKKAQSEDDAHAKATMIRSRHYKYIRRITGENELYDLQKDPHEMKNVIHDPSYAEVVTRLQDAMLQWLQETCDVVTYEMDRRMTDEMMWNKVADLVSEEDEPFVRRKIQEGIGIVPLFQIVLDRKRKEQK